MTATLEPTNIVRALRASHIRDGSRQELLQLACERLRGLGAPFTSVYAYMLAGKELVLEAFAGRETEHTRIPVGQGVCGTAVAAGEDRSEEHTSELQSLAYLVCRLLLEKKKHGPPKHLHIRTNDELSRNTETHEMILNAVRQQHGNSKTDKLTHTHTKITTLATPEEADK